MTFYATDPCESTPCKNNGKCHSENGQVKCKCSLPYFGSLCEDYRNPCQFSRCLNGGSCVPNEDFTDYTCTCQEGFKGLLCEKELGEIHIRSNLTAFCAHLILKIYANFRSL